MNKKRITWTIIAVVVIGLLVFFKLTQKKEDTKMGQGGKPGGPAPAVKVSVYVVKKQDLVNTIQAVGNLMAEDEVELRSEAMGRVIKIGFKEGQEVKKGQLLLKINDADLQAQLKKAISTQKLKDETEKRDKLLLEKGGISQETYDISFNDLKGANADIDLLREQIRKTELIAPFDGLIGLRNISEGGYVDNATVITRLQNVKQVKIEFSVPEKYSSMIRDGGDISFTVEGQNQKFDAKIYAIEPKIDPVNRNIVMRAICDNPNRKLLPGSFAKVSVTLQTNPDALMIPTQSVVPILKGQKVYLVKGDSAVDQPIEIGTRTDLNVEATKGLHEGDSVIVNGIIQIKAGSKVKVGKS